MLRRAENVSVGHQPGIFTGRGWLTLTVGKTNCYRITKIDKATFAAMSSQQYRTPVAVGRVGERTYWWFAGRFYWDNDGLTENEVYALLVTRQQRERQRIDMAQAVVAIGSAPRSTSRAAIPDDIKQYVFARDGGRCRQCGSAVDLQFDHVIPVSLGGGSTPDNLQILCGICNRRKGAGLTSGYPKPATQQLPSNGSTSTSQPASEPWWKQSGL